VRSAASKYRRSTASAERLAFEIGAREEPQRAGERVLADGHVVDHARRNRVERHRPRQGVRALLRVGRQEVRESEHRQSERREHRGSRLMAMMAQVAARSVTLEILQAGIDPDLALQTGWQRVITEEHVDLGTAQGQRRADETSSVAPPL